MTSRPIENVAFIGLGAMGLPMAGHLVKAGFPVNGFDLSAASGQSFTEQGGKFASSVGEALEDADVVITMLPTGRIVRDTLLGGDNGRKLKNRALVIDMSSSAPQDTTSLHKDLADRQVRLVDAPVSGGVLRAVNGTLSIMVGGAPDDITLAMPLLNAMGDKIFETGGIGSGHAMKAINNYISGATVIATMEGVLLGERFGLDPERIVEILNASSGRSNASEVKMKQFVLSKTFNSGFGLGLMSKDIKIASDLAQELGLKLENLSQTSDAWVRAVASIGASADHTEIMNFIETNAVST